MTLFAIWKVFRADADLHNSRLVHQRRRTYLNTRLSISRLRAAWITIFSPPVIRGQNADA
jgi:hypothetical protein